MTPFVSFVEAGRLLSVELLAVGGFHDPCVIGLNARGQLVSTAVASALGTGAEPVAIVKTGDSVTTTELPDVLGRSVIVVDDGVETGTAARAIAPLLRALGAAGLVFAVPMCPLAKLDELEILYDQVVVLHLCTDGLPLEGHYMQFDALS